MIAVAAKDHGGWTRRATRKESPASSATDRFAIPDDDDAPSLGPLSDGFSQAGRFVCGCDAGDDNEAVADLGLIHGELCKLSEGIRHFYADARKLETYVRETILPRVMAAGTAQGKR
jgi:hypothetical protein